MKAYSRAVSRSAVTLLLVGCAITTFATPMGAGPLKPQITILYDAFGKDSAMQKDWGYAALVEYGGKRILSTAATTRRSLPRTQRQKAPTCRSWISLSCRTATAITWEDWPTCCR